MKAKKGEAMKNAEFGAVVDGLIDSRRGKPM